MGYTLKKTLVKHRDSINTLAFSHDGFLFASGADDGLVIIFEGNGSGKEIRRFQVKAPVTTVLWHTLFGYTIVAGDSCGDVHTICLEGSTKRNSFYHTVNNVLGPVHCIAQSGIWLAIGSGKVVQLIKQGTIATWERATLLPDPPKFPELDGELPDPMARSLHFLGANDDVLLVTYLDHGVIAWNLKTLEINWRIRPRSCKIGCSAISPNEKTLAVTNLYDGIDWYSLTSNHFTDACFQRTTTHTIPENVILPVTFVHGGNAVLSGTSYGCARISNSKDWSLLEKLPHEPDDIVQAIAYSSGGCSRQIVTGVSERGSESVIRYWVQERISKKHVEPEPQTAEKRVQAYLKLALQKPASTVIFIVLGLAFLAAFPHRHAGPIYWLRGFSDAKLGPLESQAKHWWQWASREGNDGHQDPVLLPGQHLGPVSEPGTNEFQVTTEALSFADPIGPPYLPRIGL